MLKEFIAKIKSLGPSLLLVFVLLGLVFAIIGMFVLQGRMHEAIWNSNLPWVIKAILG